MASLFEHPCIILHSIFVIRITVSLRLETTWGVGCDRPPLRNASSPRSTRRSTRDRRIDEFSMKVWVPLVEPAAVTIVPEESQQKKRATYTPSHSYCALCVVDGFLICYSYQYIINIWYMFSNKFKYVHRLSPTDWWKKYISWTKSCMLDVTYNSYFCC